MTEDTEELDLFLDDDGMRPIGPVTGEFAIDNEERLAWFTRRVFKYTDEVNRIEQNYRNRKARLEGQKAAFLAQFGGQAEAYLAQSAMAHKGKLFRDTEWGRISVRRHKPTYKVINADRMLSWFRNFHPAKIAHTQVEEVPKQAIQEYALAVRINPDTGEEIPLVQVWGVDYVPERTHMVLSDIPGYRGGVTDAEPDA